jgi:short-subunit dehydrogenase
MSLPRPAPDTTVLITGASSGIGAELARQLAARGHHTTLVARRQERLDELSAELRDRWGAGSEVLTCNLAAQRPRGQLIRTLRDGERRVIGVCNCAGWGLFGQAPDLPVASQVEMVRVNVEALHELTLAFLDDMLERDAGAILNIASTASYQPMPGLATYAATKTFVLAFSESLHGELAGTGVSCTTLAPGPTRTEFFDVAGAGDPGGPLERLFVLPVEEVARAGIEGMERGRRVVVPGPVNHALAEVGRVSPRSVVIPLVKAAGHLVHPALGRDRQSS